MNTGSEHSTSSQETYQTVRSLFSILKSGSYSATHEPIYAALYTHTLHAVKTMEAFSQRTPKADLLRSDMRSLLAAADHITKEPTIDSCTITTQKETHIQHAELTSDTSGSKKIDLFLHKRLANTFIRSKIEFRPRVYTHRTAE